MEEPFQPYLDSIVSNDFCNRKLPIDQYKNCLKLRISVSYVIGKELLFCDEI